jgi:hypothetical protein
MTNKWFKILNDLIGNSHPMPLHKHCMLIQRFYRKHLQPFQKDKREWTLRSIRKHLVQDGGLNSHQRIDHLKRMTYTLASKLSDVGILLRDPHSSQETCDVSNVTLLMRLAQNYVMLDKYQSSIGKM